MNYVTRLLNELDKSNIALYNSKNDCIEAASIEYNGNYAIFLNAGKIKNTDDFFVKAAHEYGHCSTGALHKLNSPFDVIGKHERIANQKSVEDFLPSEQILNAVKSGCRQLYEIADFVGMPEKFVKKAVEIYKLKGEI